MSSTAKQLTYQESIDAHAREYLTRVLTAAGGERQRAAEIAGLNRTHLQSLLKRYAIEIPFDPKARGRRKTKSEESSASDEQADTSEAPRNAIRF